jgi:hypothetical protein
MVLPGCLEYVISSHQYMHDSDKDAVASRWTRCYWICKSPRLWTLGLSSRANISKDGVAHMIEGNSFSMQCDNMSLRAKKFPVLRLSAPGS